jgi:HEAT repeat protein
MSQRRANSAQSAGDQDALAHRSRRFQISIRNLAIAVACCAVIVWGWRQLADSRGLKTTADFVKMLGARSAAERIAAAVQLGMASPADVAIVAPALVQALSDSDAKVRSQAAISLGLYLGGPTASSGNTIAAPARNAANALLAAIEHDAHPHARATAVYALASLLRNLRAAGLKPDPVIPADPFSAPVIVSALDRALERDAANRLAYLLAFDCVETARLPAPPALLNALEDPSADLRARALVAISRFGAGVDRAVSVLLRDVNGRTSLYLLAAEQMRPSPAVVPMLIRSLESTNCAERQAAAVLLRRIGPAASAATPSVIAALRQGTNSSVKPDRQVNSLVSSLMRALAHVAPAEDAVPILIEALRAEGSHARSAAASALGEIGPDAHEAIPILVALVKELAADPDRTDWGNSVAIAWALGRIAPNAPVTEKLVQDVVAALGEAMESPYDLVRSAAAEALVEFGPRATAAIPRLVAALDDSAGPVRAAAARSLGKIGPVASAAIAKIRALLDDDDRRVRLAAASALDQIVPRAKASGSPAGL